MNRFASIALSLVALVSTASQAAAPAASLRDWARKSEARLAYGIYIGGKKVGWIIEETRLAALAGRPVFQTVTEEFMETLFDGEKTLKRERAVTSYELAGDGAVVCHDSCRVEDGKETRRWAERVGGRLRITTKAAGRTLIREVPLPKDTLANARDLERWLQGNRQRGDHFTRFGVSWEARDVNSKQHYLFRERKTVPVAGRPKEVLAVEITVEGGKMEALVFPDSRTVSADVGKLLSIRLEGEAAARKVSRPIDLMDLTSVYVDRPLGPARKVRLLRLEATGLGNFAVPASHRQAITREKGRTVIELRRDFRVAAPAGLSPAQSRRYLETTPRLQVDQEPVRDLARKVAGSGDAVEKARRLAKWVYQKLEKSYASNGDSALEVLDNKAGDCTEHALLFVALCRAAGVPAREVGGLAYVGGKKPAFGWHAWAEFHDGKQWVSVDPTWDELFVDATHLKMSEGNRDMAWTNVLGRLKMKVLEVQTGE